MGVFSFGVVTHWGTPPVRLTPRVGGITLRLNGVGFKGFWWNSTLVFQLGYSHYLGLVTPSTGVVVRSRRGNLAVGAPRGDLSARVVRLREPDPYKARGVYPVDAKPSTKPGKRR